MPGPIPKRDEERIRRNAPEIPTETVEVFGPVIIPDLGIEDAHPLISEFWESLKKSGQSRFYEPSDWVYAKLVLTLMNSSLEQLGYVTAAQLQQYNVMLSNLLVSEGDRRRARLEIERRPVGVVNGDDGTVVNASDRFKAKFTRPVANAAETSAS